MHPRIHRCDARAPAARPAALLLRRRLRTLTARRSASKSGSPGRAGPPANAFNASGAAVSLPHRWSQHETDEKEATQATANAVYMASSAAARRESSRRSSANSSVASRNSAFEDDDMVDTDAEYRKEFEDPIVDDDDAIGKVYDAVTDHESIRQEALRMLEVADADQHYSVHRTITGGFTAQARPLGGSGSKKPKALSALRFTAGARKGGYRDFTASGSPLSREDYEYGESNESVVDVVGMEQRALGNAEANSPDKNKDGSSSNWSNRYSLDNTMLAMSGGAMKMGSGSSGNANNDTSSERFSARNLFGGSPTKSSQVFGSGFSFRQKHVFGKQGAVAVMNNGGNLQQSWTDASDLDGTLSSNGNRLKTWQEQLLHKKRQQRRLLLCVCSVLLLVIVPLAAVVGHQETNQQQAASAPAVVVPSDGTNGGVTFYVTADVPYNANEEADLVHELAHIALSTSFAVHLGNIQNAEVTGCVTGQYQTVADLLEEHSPRTVFVVPGQEDWNNCPDPVAAWDQWYDNFQFFNDRWDDTANYDEFEVFHQKDLLENWGFLHREVLFLGVHVVNGNVPDSEEFKNRHTKSYQWVSEMALEFVQKIHAVVVFGNAKPGFPQGLDFFAPLEDFMRTFDTPMLYVHAASGQGGIEENHPFVDSPHLTALQVETGINTPPLRVNVGYGDNVFVFGERA